jgi:hypothetical protein
LEACGRRFKSYHPDQLRSFGRCGHYVCLKNRRTRFDPVRLHHIRKCFKSYWECGGDGGVAADCKSVPNGKLDGSNPSTPTILERKFVAL